MKSFSILCVLALAISSVLALRTDRTMAALEELESLLNQQLLSEIVQQQDYDEAAAKEELLGVLQRACNRGGSSSAVQSLASLADMLDRNQVSTQEAVDVIQAQGGLLGTLISGALGGGAPKATPAPPAPAVIPTPAVLRTDARKKVAEELDQVLQKKLVKDKLAEEIINKKASETQPKSRPTKLGLALKGAAKKPSLLFRNFLAELQSFDEEVANEENYDMLDDVDMENYDLLDDVDMENYDLFDDVESEEYERAVVEDDTVRTQLLGLLGSLLG